MKIDLNVTQINSALSSAGVSSPKKSFTEVLRNSGSVFDMNPPPALQKLEAKLLSGGTFSNKEILGAQVIIHKYNMRVELVSKSAEALTSTAKRFQQQN